MWGGPSAPRLFCGLPSRTGLMEVGEGGRREDVEHDGQRSDARIKPFSSRAKRCAKRTYGLALALQSVQMDPETRVAGAHGCDALRIVLNTNNSTPLEDYATVRGRTRERIAVGCCLPASSWRALLPHMRSWMLR